jgi:hypothetical protein
VDGDSTFVSSAVPAVSSTVEHPTMVNTIDKASNNDRIFFIFFPPNTLLSYIKRATL